MIAVLAARRAAAARARIAAALGAVPGVRVREEGEAVVVEGRDLRRRRLGDARLRWPGAIR